MAWPVLLSLPFLNLSEYATTGSNLKTDLYLKLPLSTHLLSVEENRTKFNKTPCEFKVDDVKDR